jgi:hypothetical protein
VGHERAETYLRLLAEAELRRVGDQLRRLDPAAAADTWSRPDMSLFGTTERAQWKVVRTARILVAAGVLDQECLAGVADDLHSAIKIRSRLLLNWDRRRGVLHGAPELFAPLTAVLADVDGAWFGLAGLSSAAGESHLHVVSVGLPPLAERFSYGWTPGFSWWLADGGGLWHVGTAGEPWTFGDGSVVFRLRLIPPLTAIPDALELVLTGPSTQVRIRFPVPP